MIEPKRLGEVLPKEMVEFAAQKLDNFLDKDIVIHSCREVQGQRGSYMRIVVSLTMEGDKFHLATGAAQPVEVLAYLSKNLLFPVVAKFERSGNAIVLKS